jgi:hypothetical protein
MTPRSQLQRDTRGAVYVEFLVIFLILLVWILSLVQTALLRHGHLAVQRAADAAARSASVVMDDDPKYYGGEARNQVTASSGSGDGVGDFLSWAGVGGGGGGSASRMGTIRAAAGYPLMSLTPPVNAEEGSKSVNDALGAAVGYNPAKQAAAYNNAALAVTFPSSYKSTGTKTSVEHDGPVLVRVTYAFHCGIPLARNWICKDLGSLKEDKYATDFKGGGLDALETFGAAKYVLLKAESEMQNQGATYEY